MGTPFRVGIVGYGGFGQFLHSAWGALPAVEVVAVADAVAPLPDALRTYRDAGALLADPDVDLVSICTPPATHADLACRALAAGKHVLIEKPLATTRADADRILEAQRVSGKVAGVNYVLRYTPVVEWIIAASRVGTFGPLRRATVENIAQDEALPPGHWFWDRAQSGGILVEHAVHFIDLIGQCAPGEATAVRGTVLRRADGRADRMALEARYGDALLTHQYHAFTRPRVFEQTRLYFGFETLDLHVEGWIPLHGTARALVTSEARACLETLPGWQETACREAEGTAGRLLVEGRFAAPQSKDAIYRAGVQQALLDVIAATQNADHRPRVGLGDARQSLEVALRATEAA